MGCVKEVKGNAIKGIKKMSYDVSIGEFNTNYTSNGCEIFYEHIPENEFAKGGIPSLDGMLGAQAIIVLSDFFDNIQRERQEIGSIGLRAKYDAPNGWGSTEGLLLFAAQIMSACIKNLGETVRVSY